MCVFLNFEKIRAHFHTVDFPVATTTNHGNSPAFESRWIFVWIFPWICFCLEIKYKIEIHGLALWFKTPCQNVKFTGRGAKSTWKFTGSAAAQKMSKSNFFLPPKFRPFLLGLSKTINHKSTNTTLIFFIKEHCFWWKVWGPAGGCDPGLVRVWFFYADESGFGAT